MSAGATCPTRPATVFMRLAWPVGTEVDWVDRPSTDDQAPQFVRDPSGTGIKTLGQSDLDAELPPRARPTGFNHNGNTLSVGATRDAVYVTRPGGTVERWARVESGEGCA